MELWDVLTTSRELHEEMGVRADMRNAELAFTLKREDSFCDVW